ncbi:MAG: hypothetical protein FJX77_02400 [Armatimonadetes bacterium]|nr:hypothetical protein [Armatimonadota bacterium]
MSAGSDEPESTQIRAQPGIPVHPGAALLAEGRVFQLREREALTPRTPEGEYAALLEGARRAGQATAAAAEIRNVAELLRRGQDPPPDLREVLSRIWDTRGLVAEMLLEQGVDDLSESGENYLRSAEWARRVQKLSPWEHPESRIRAAELLEHMAELEAEAAEALLRWSANEE